MKTMMLTGIREMEMRVVPDPCLTSDADVLLKQSMVGVCGSDIHYYNEGRIGSQVVQYPYAVGHEFSAVVMETGKSVTRVRKGDRVAVDPAVSCGHCDQCAAGRPHTCRNLLFLGCPGQAPGCLAEYLVMPESCCYPIGREMTMEQAALSEPLAISFYSVKLAGGTADKKAGILGCGPIGLGVLLCARALGCGSIYATDRIPARLDAASSAGADWVGNPDSEDITASIIGLEPMLLDVVFDCCGRQDALDQAIQLLKPGGKLVIVGIPEVERISFVIDEMRRREICVQNVRRQCECTGHVLEMMAEGRLNADFMVTHRFPFERTKEAFDLVAAYRDGVIKAIIEF